MAVCRVTCQNVLLQGKICMSVSDIYKLLSSSNNLVMVLNWQTEMANKSLLTFSQICFFSCNYKIMPDVLFLAFVLFCSTIIVRKRVNDSEIHGLYISHLMHLLLSAVKPSMFVWSSTPLLPPAVMTESNWKARENSVSSNESALNKTGSKAESMNHLYIHTQCAADLK